MGGKSHRGWTALSLLVAGCGGGGGDTAGMEDSSSPDAASLQPDASSSTADGPAGTDALSVLEGGDDAGPADSGHVVTSGRDAEAGVPPLTCAGEVSEPNDGEVIATPLPGIGDCDGSGSSQAGVASGTGDVDWLHFRGTDTAGCSVDPTVAIDASGLRLCAFIMCPEGVTTVSGCAGGVRSSSAAGTPGCCTTATAPMTVQMNCSGTDDSADVYIRVDQPEADACVPYHVAYHF